MTTEVVKTIRASGGDYTSLSAWEAALPASLVAVDEQHTAVCYNDWPSGLSETIVDVSGVTTDATRYPRIEVAAGHGHGGISRAGFWITANSGSNTVSPFALNVPYAVAEGIEVNNERLSPSAAVIFGAANTEVYGAIVTTGGSGGLGFMGGGTNGNHTDWAQFYNCMAIGMATGFGSTVSARTKYKAYNCASVNNGTAGFYSGSTDKCWTKNCVAYSNGTGYSGTRDTTNSTHCASGDTSASVFTGGITNITSAEFVDAANGDFHLAAGSQLIGAGTNLYANFDHDIDGDIRPSSGAWDIGFDHYVAGGGGTASGGVTEAITLSDTVEASVALAASVTEALALSDTVDVPASGAPEDTDDLCGGVLGGGTLCGDGVATPILAEAAESLALGDSTTAAVSTISAAVAESLSLGESTAAAVTTTAAAVAESLALVDAVDGVSSAPGVESITESVALGDTVGATVRVSAGIAETIALLDQVSGVSASGVLSASLSEALALSDASNALVLVSASVTEAVVLEDLCGAVEPIYGAVVELLDLTEAVDALVIQALCPRRVTLTTARAGVSTAAGGAALTRATEYADVAEKPVCTLD